MAKIKRAIQIFGAKNIQTKITWMAFRARNSGSCESKLFFWKLWCELVPFPSE